MVLGLIQYRCTAHHLGNAGQHPERTGTRRRDQWLFAGGLGAVALVTALGLSGVIRLNPVVMARGTGLLLRIFARPIKNLAGGVE